MVAKEATEEEISPTTTKKTKAKKKTMKTKAAVKASVKGASKKKKKTTASAKKTTKKTKTKKKSTKKATKKATKKSKKAAEPDDTTVVASSTTVKTKDKDKQSSAPDSSAPEDTDSPEAVNKVQEARNKMAKEASSHSFQNDNQSNRARNSNYNNPRNSYSYNNNRKSNYNNQRNNNNNGSLSTKKLPALQVSASREFNQQLIGCESAKELLLTLQNQKGALTSPAGGGRLNSVNFSTAIHRIARHLNNFFQQHNNNNQNNQQQQQRRQHNQQHHNPHNDAKHNRAVILSDPRFALFLCSLAEALGEVPYMYSYKQFYQDKDGNTKRQKVPCTLQFGARDMSNIAWAVAKMKIAPPQSASPLLSQHNYKTLLLNTAKQLRDKVVQVAKTKTTSSSSHEVNAEVWIPTLSLLCGHVMDTIGIMVLQSYQQKSGPHVNNPFQERANLLWALATAQRANPDVFEGVIHPMVADMERQLSSGNSNSNSNQQQQYELRPQEWSNSIWAFATAQCFGEGQVRLLIFMATVLETVPAFAGMFKPQEFANTAWSVATLLSKKGIQAVDESEQAAALVILRHVARAITERASQFKTQELSNTAWAFATLGFGMTADSTVASSWNSLNDYVLLKSDQPQQDEALLRDATTAILKDALPRIHKFRSQELNNIAWALARMGRKDELAESVLEAIGWQLAEERRRVTSQDIGTTLWSFASLEYKNDKLYRAIASRLAVDRARFFKPQELSNTVWALATAEIAPQYPDTFDSVLIPPKRRFQGPLRNIDDPITRCFGVAAEQLMRRPFEFKSQELKDVLYSFSKIGIRHPDLFKATAEHLVGSDDTQQKSRNSNNHRRGSNNRVRGFDDFSPQGLGNMAWAYARQAQLVEDVNKRNDISATVATKTGKMAVYATSFFDVGEGLVHRLFGEIAEANLRVHDNLERLKPQDISNTAWAMALLGMKHRQFLDAAYQQLIERAEQFMQGRKNAMTIFKGQEICNLLWAFAILNFPARDMGSTIGPYMIRATACQTNDSSDSFDIERIARMFKRMELGNIAWSCAVFGDFEPELMRFLYSGLIGASSGIGRGSSMEDLNQCFGDGGLQSEAVMSLIYLQLAMELERKNNGLCFPGDFPDGWTRQSLADRSNGFGELEFALQLSTSNLQKDVSKAFHRIGFDHVLEHVIRLDELLENNREPLAAVPLDVLSIDIADVQARIAVEVDGPTHFVTDIEMTADQGYPKVHKGRLDYSFKMSRDRNPVNGPTALKERLLGLLGWKTINIPFWEWYDLNGDEKLEEEYCRRLLEQAKQ